MNLLLVLALHFLFLSLIAIGGATAALPEMHRVLVTQLHLMADDQFAHLFAISQATPGPNVIFVGLFGWQTAGLAGALVSLFAMCGPASLFAIGFERFGFGHRNDHWYVLIRRTLTPIAIGLLLSSAVLLMKTATKPLALFLTLLSATVLLRTRMNPLWLIGLGAVVGVMGWV